MIDGKTDAMIRARTIEMIRAGDGRRAAPVPARRPPLGRSASYATTIHPGAYGFTRSGIRASADVRSRLPLLHRPHAVTVLVHSFPPPRERGGTWSTVVAGPPQ
jgi:hypothetical protein